MNNVNEFVCSQLAKYRVEAGYTQKTAAEKLNLSRVTIVNMENCKQGVAPKHIWAFACIYKQPIAAFFPPLVEPL